MRTISGLPGEELSQTNSSNYVLLYFVCLHFAIFGFLVVVAGSTETGRHAQVTRTRSRENVLKNLGQMSQHEHRDIKIIFSICIQL